MKSRETEGQPGGMRVAGGPDELPGWVHYVWFIYLGFLFMPLLSPGRDRVWLWPTLVSIPVFIYLYRRIVVAFRERLLPGPAALPEVLAIAAMAYVLAFFNENANTYLIYCMGVAPFALAKFRHLVLLLVAVLGGYALVLWMVGFNPVMFGIAAGIGGAVAVSNHMFMEHRRKNALLRLSREEVHRLGRVAERERIGRDLHDLLGHTLSLIAIKSELAAKLIERDKAAAAREVAEVTNIAREALKQVRTAVAGIRAAALENEVASAKTLLDTAGVALTFERAGGMLPPEIETAAAMILREAVTNIQRHSRARRASVAVLTRVAASVAGSRGAAREVLLTVSDDGRGGITARGNGLTGIGERVRSLGGTWELDSPRGKGTILRVRLPLPDARPAQAPAGAGEPVRTVGEGEALPRARVVADADDAMPSGAGGT